MSVRFTRRQVIIGGATAAALAASTKKFPAQAATSGGPAGGAGGSPAGGPTPGHVDPAALSRFTEPLPVMPTIDRRGGGSLALTAANSRHRFHRALALTPTFAFGGLDYLGPTIEVQRNRTLTVKMRNALGPHPLASAIDPALLGSMGGMPAMTGMPAMGSSADAVTPRLSVHLHGGNTAARHDGQPEATFLPGTEREYDYENTQEATNLWYHDHTLGMTRLNTFAGLVGNYVIRDAIDTGRPDNRLGLPSGELEIPLLLQDRAFKDDGSFDYPPAPWAPEFFGDVAVVNGAVWPYLDVARGWYRFRIINGANARYFRIALSTGQPFVQLGAEQGLFDRPVPMTSVLLGPGERADVLVDFSNAAPGDVVTMTNDAHAPFPNGDEAPAIPEIMQFKVGTAIGWRRTPPTSLRSRPVNRLTVPADASRRRTMVLVEIAPPDGDPVAVLLNNQHYDSQNIARPVANTVELWTIVNTTEDAHPIHIHEVPFIVQDRQALNAAAYKEAYNPALCGPDPVAAGGTGPWPGLDADAFLVGSTRPPMPNEMGWKDTVTVYPGEVVRLLVPFGAEAAPDLPFGATNLGSYVWHCHILEHEDMDMMQRFEIVRRGH